MRLHNWNRNTSNLIEISFNFNKRKPFKCLKQNCLKWYNWKHFATTQMCLVMPPFRGKA